MIIIKDKTVNLSGLMPQMSILIQVMDKLYEQAGADCVITSANDASHSTTSLHYAGAALDFRINNITKAQAQKIVGKANDALKQDYDVILEGNHIHAEYQPKKR